MTNLLTKLRVILSHLIILLLAACVTTEEEGLRLENRNNAISKISQELKNNGEIVHVAISVHFYKKRWENVSWKETKPPSDVTGQCDNDILVVTDKKIYIYENYMKLLDRHNIWGCSESTGSATLRPKSIQVYDINQIKHIERINSSLGLGRWEKYPFAYALHFRNNNTPDEIAYIATPHRYKKEMKSIFNAFNRYKHHAFIRIPRCQPDAVDASHNCWAPISTKGPFFRCSDVSYHGKDQSLSYLSYKLRLHTMGFNKSIVHPWSYEPFAKKTYHNCADDIDLWSSDKDVAKTLHDANDKNVLYIGDERYDGACHPIHQGYWSIKEFTIRNCEEKWYRVGGRKSGPCEGMNGVKVRRYTVGDYNCYFYDKVEGFKTIDEYYNR